MMTQTLWGLAVFAVLTILGIAVGLPAYQQAQNESFMAEMAVVSQAGSRAINGLGAAGVTSFQILPQRGYLPAQRYSNGTNELSNGGTVTAAGDGTTNTITFTAEADDDEMCLYAVDNAAQLVKVDTAPTCTNEVLTFVVTR